MKKFLFSAVISAILNVNAFGADLLASLTNGKISDNSPGVKVLSLEEAKQVKGGYEISQPYIFNDTQINNFRIMEARVWSATDYLSKSAKVVTIHNDMMKQVRNVSRTNKIVNEVYRAKGNELNRILFSKYWFFILS